MEFYNNLNNLYKRIFWGKLIGFIIGILLFLWIILFIDDSSIPFLKWGILFWYASLGGIVGLMGIINYHPLLKINLGISRGILIGGFMNVLLLFFASDTIIKLINEIGLNFSTFQIFIAGFLEGAIICGIIDYILTKNFSQGEELLK